MLPTISKRYLRPVTLIIDRFIIQRLCQKLKKVDSYSYEFLVMSKIQFDTVSKLVFFNSHCTLAMLKVHIDKYIYVIHQPGGPYWEKLCPTSWIPPEAVGRGQYPRQRAQFFPIRTDLVLVNNIFIFF